MEQQDVIERDVSQASLLSENTPEILHLLEFRDQKYETVKRCALRQPFNFDTVESLQSQVATIIELTTILPYSEDLQVIFETEEKSGLSLRLSEKIADGHRLKINSLHIINALRSVVKYNTNQSLSEDTLTLRDPFKLLVYHIEQLAGFAEAQPSNHDEDYKQTCTKHISTLLAFFDSSPCFDAVRKESMRHKAEQPTCTFDHIWTLFKPGQLCYMQDEGRLVGPFVIAWSSSFGSTEGERGIIEIFEVTGWNIQFDGTVFGRISRSCRIRSFTDETLVSALDAVPAAFCTVHHNKDMKKRLIARGRDYWLLSKELAYRSYHGATLQQPSKELKGRVMVDPKSYILWQSDDRSREFSRRYMRPEEDYFRFPRVNDRVSAREIKNIGCQCEKCEHNDPSPAFPYQSYDRLKPDVDLPPDETQFYMLCDERLFAFNLRQLKLELISVDGVKALNSQNTFDQLVLDAEVKDAITALTGGLYIRSADRPHSLPNDFIEGKGEGKIILLHGPPGVGKTATAEAISDKVQRPLLSLTCADLGVYAREVEENLDKFLKLGERWGAVVLIDEADIYLESRDLRDIKRNSLVSVFLRALKYYTGLLILTTNRIKTFDEAFKSRIHVSLNYQTLKEYQRTDIWNNHFRTLEDNNIEIKAAARYYILKDLAVRDLEWNGREIRNAFSTAVALAEHDYHEMGQRKVIISLDHMQKFVRISQAFKDYMYELHEKRGDDFIAKETHLRLDSYRRVPKSGTPNQAHDGRDQSMSRGLPHGNQYDGVYHSAYTQPLQPMNQTSSVAESTYGRVNDDQYAQEHVSATGQFQR